MSETAIDIIMKVTRGDHRCYGFAVCGACKSNAKKILDALEMHYGVIELENRSLKGLLVRLTEKMAALATEGVGICKSALQR